MKVIVGLGNPGASYRHTRHNVGFEVLDRLAARLDARFEREKFKAQIAEGAWRGTKILLLKPLTYMNKSGECVAMAARNNVNDPDDLLVIYDDVDLPLGRVRLRAQGSPGTHNGMRSVVERMGHREVPRLRIGVGMETGGKDMAGHVLSTFRPEEKAVVEAAVERAADAAVLWSERGIEAAMNAYNRAEEPPKDKAPA